MSQREVRVPFEALGDPQTITQKNREMFLKEGLDMQRDECDIEDDDTRRERVYKINNRRTYIFLSR